MTFKRFNLGLNINQVITTILVVLIGLLLLDLVNVAVTNYRLQQLDRQLSHEIKGLDQEIAILRDRTAQANSDAVVERIAREQLGLVKPGDVLVVPLQPNGSSLTRSWQPGAGNVDVTVAPASTAEENASLPARLWQGLLFFLAHRF
ncbi:MAG: septum formation initiator family protein [Chloroflexi bacterium]|nr:septum formation initiator family protein [Chloroflexota bacterium]